MADDKVEVTVGADVSGLEEGMQAGAAAVDSGTAAMVAAFETGCASMTAQLEQLVAITRESFIDMAREEEQLAEVIKEKSEEEVTALGRVKESMETFATGIGSLHKAFQLIYEVATIGFIGEIVADLGKDFAEFGEKVEIAAHKIGMSTDAIQQFGFAAKLSGVSTEQMDSAMVRMARSIADAQQGVVKSQQAYESLGISLNELKNGSFEEIFMKVSEAVSHADDDMTKAAIVTRIFGRSSAELIAMLDKGPETIKEFMERAKELGIVMGEQDVRAAALLAETLKETDAMMEAVKRRAGAELAPIMYTLAESMEKASEKGGFLDDMFSGLAFAMKGLMSVAIGLVLDFEQIAEVIVTAGVAANYAVHGQFAEAISAINTGLDEMSKHAHEADEAMQKLWADTKGLDFGEGPNNWGEEEKKTKLKLGSGKAEPKGSGPGQVALWKQELQEQEEASGNFFKSNLAEEDAFWSSKLALTKAGSKEYLAVFHELFSVKKQEAHQDLANAVESIKAEYDDAAQGGMERIELADQIAQRIGASYGKDSKEFEQATREKEKTEREWEAAQVKGMNDILVQKQKVGLTDIALETEKDKGRLARAEITQQEEIADLLAFENRKYAIELETINEQLKLYADDETNYRKTLDAKYAATAKHALETEKIQQQAADATQRAWVTALSPISGAFTASINGMLAGTRTWQQIMGNMIDSILAKYIDLGVQMLVNWTATEAAKMTASMNSSAILQALGLQDAVTSKTTATGEAMGIIGSDAAVAGAGAYAATAAIPYIGPALAPAAAAEAYSATLSFEGLAGFAAGAWTVPTDMVANIHKDEMVLPSWGAQGIRDLIGSGGANKGGGNNTVNVNTTMNGNSDAAFKGMLMQHADVIAAAVKQQMRNFQR